MELATATVKVQIDTADLARQLSEANNWAAKHRAAISDAGRFMLDLLGAYAAEGPTWHSPEPGTFVLEWDRLDVDAMLSADTNEDANEVPPTPMTSTITIRTEPRV